MAGLSTEELLDQLSQIQKYTSLYTPKATRGKIASQLCCPSKYLRNRGWRKNSVSISSVVPNVGNTTAAE